MKKKNVLLFLLLSWVGTALQAKAQQITAGGDLVSKYIWRGMECGNASIQPTVGIEYNGLSFTAWGSADFTGKTVELDLTIEYSIGAVEFSITDYYVKDQENSSPYFNYTNGAGHVIEGTATYTVSEKIPLALSWNTYFAGTDNEFRNHDYSSYVEAAYPFSLWKIDLCAEVGITPWKGAYASTFNIVNLGVSASKELPVSKRFTPSVFVKASFNPSESQAFMVFGLSI